MVRWVLEVVRTGSLLIVVGRGVGLFLRLSRRRLLRLPRNRRGFVVSFWRISRLWRAEGPGSVLWEMNWVLCSVSIIQFGEDYKVLYLLVLPFCYVKRRNWCCWHMSQSCFWCCVNLGGNCPLNWSLTCRLLPVVLSASVTALAWLFPILELLLWKSSRECCARREVLGSVGKGFQ